jgi:conjugal transfer mating pair stabilization protein TraG
VANRLSAAYESGEALSIDLAQLPVNSDFMQRYQRLAAEYGSDSLALQAAMASELATRALPPTRNEAVFSALPASFADVLRTRDADLQEPAFDPSRVDSADRSNDRSTSPRLSGQTLVPPDLPTALNGVRDDVTARTSQAWQRQSAAETFDQRNEITRSPDGTIGTRRSQAMSNARQLRDDVANLADQAREVFRNEPVQAAAAADAANERIAKSQRARDIAATAEIPTMLPKGGKRSR